MTLNSKLRLALLLLVVFSANLVETKIESHRRGNTPVSAADSKAAYAMQRFEQAIGSRFLNFAFHDKSVWWAAYAYSFSYFILFPIGGLLVVFALARRDELAPFRVFCLAVAIDYALSLPLFMLFPVPERWAYPESGAILLSDLWSSTLITAIRPMSAINNCFPSTHTSLTVILLAVCWRFDFRFRWTATALGLTVILSTFVLGIHWLPDIIAGVVVGLLSVDIARRFTDTSERRELARYTA